MVQEEALSGFGSLRVVQSCSCPVEDSKLEVSALQRHVSVAGKHRDATVVAGALRGKMLNLCFVGWTDSCLGARHV